MHDSPLVFSAWESFYVIVGSSSAALTGLMFVVVSLIPEAGLATSGESLAAFGTPTVVHFGLALLVSAVVSAPWTSVAPAALAVGAVGFGGLAYTGVVFLRARRQTEYQPVFEDWLWHTLLPLAAYVGLVVMALLLPGRPTGPSFGIAAGTASLLFIGIHNAWDTVIYIALERLKRSRRGEDSSDSEES